MPEFHPPITAEEFAQRRSVRTTRVDLNPYIAYVNEIPRAGAGRLTLTPNEKKSTVKRRVSLAAGKMGKEIKYLRSGENELLFEVVASP